MAASKRAKRQRFEIRRVHRSKLLGAPYNPRYIDKRTLGKLRSNLERVGLIEPPIWNETTGFVVGGHQRLAALDALEGSEDYELDVAVVQLDEKTEREQNIFLNNPSAQGSWDLPLLTSLIQEIGSGSIAETGFDSDELSELLGIASPSTAASAAVDVAITGSPVGEAAGGTSGGPANKPPEVVLRFQTRAERAAFMISVGLPADDRYIDGKRMLGLLPVHQVK